MVLALYSLVLLASACWASSGAFIGQTSLGGGRWEAGPSLRSLSSEFSTFAHGVFPDHSVRIAKADGFCDPTVGVYTGYVDVGARHLFFYFFESRRAPETDDVMLWINGGPGGSSSIGLLMELGPCNIAGPNSTEFNPHGWNAHVNLLFVDQPAGVGFSYADHGVVSSTEEAAQDIAALFSILSASFPAFQGRPLHLAGESYGGRYIPAFGAAVYDNNARLVEWGLEAINLVSVITGNGWSDELTMMSSYQEMQCTNASGLAPVQSISTCVRMKQISERCQKSVKQHCYDTLDYMDCDAAYHYCEMELYISIRTQLGRNPYDMSKMCVDGAVKGICYGEAGDIVSYLNSSRTRTLLHTDALPAQFDVISRPIAGAFGRAGDIHRNSAPQLAALLERGVRALVYAGTRDLACSWLANERMTRGLAWAGQAAFGAQELRAWDVDGRVAGRVRAHGGLTYATVDGAGHMVPYDKPAESLAMITRWLAGQHL